VTPRQIAQRIRDELGLAPRDEPLQTKHPRIDVEGADWRRLAEFLYRDAELSFDWLACITAIDYVAADELAACYELRSTRHGHWFAVKAFVPRSEPRLASVTDIWPAADWHEREAWDLMGIVFEGHPDPRRILLPEDWQGHPLRKDYVFPREYHGIPATTELDWSQKTDFPA
jgi:NADH-quinone oxidoreductase subunit C